MDENEQGRGWGQWIYLVPPLWGPKIALDGDREKKKIRKGLGL